MKSVHFSVDLAFEITLKQHKNFCNQSQTDTCRNNQWLSLDFDCRQTSAISTDKTFAVYKSSVGLLQLISKSSEVVCKWH